MKTLPKCGMDVLVYLASQKTERKVKAEENRKKKEKYMEDLLADIARVFDVDMEIIKSGDSKGMCVLVRKIFYYITKTKKDYDYLSMALIAGRMDHTAVIYHIRRVTAFLKVEDPEFMVLWDKYLTNSKLYTKKDFI